MSNSIGGSPVISNANVRLANIPPDAQKMYKIGETVDVVADGSVGGGHFTFLNLEGREIGADAVEFYRYPRITVEDL